MTETARLAALRAARAVAVREVGGDVLQLRLPAQRLPPAPPAARPAARHARRARDPRPPVRGARRCSARTTYAPLRAAAEEGRAAFADAFFAAAGRQARARPARAGRALPHARADAARRARPPRPCCGAPPTAARRRTRRRSPRPASTARGSRPGEQLFDAILASPSGLVFSVDEPDVGWSRLTHRRRAGPPRHPRAARRARRASPPRRRPAGDPTSRSSCPPASAARSPPTRSSATRRGGSATPAARCGSARPTPPGSASSTATSCGSPPSGAAWSRRVEVSDMMQPGHVSLPNGLGLDYPGEDGAPGRHRRGARTSSPPARTATGSPARRGTSTCRPASSACRRGLNRAPHPLRRPGRARSPGPPT